MNREVEIASALADIRSKIPEHVTLIVVTKTFPVTDVEILYRLGERDFGENRDEEGLEKSSKLSNDAIWHFQGNIQSNKIRSIVSWADYIHSLDDLRHAGKIDSVASLIGKKQKVFIQINLDQRSENSSDSLIQVEGRSGIKPEEFDRFSDSLLEFSSVEVVGVMGVGPLGLDPSPGFELLQELSKALQVKRSEARYISAGMSGDFPIALRFGATHIRIGSSILGSR